MATIRWCPIYPKWDSYQPLIETDRNTQGLVVVPACEGPRMQVRLVVLKDRGHLEPVLVRLGAAKEGQLPGEFNGELMVI